MKSKLWKDRIKNKAYHKCCLRSGYQDEPQKIVINKYYLNDYLNKHKNYKNMNTKRYKNKHTVKYEKLRMPWQSKDCKRKKM